MIDAVRAAIDDDLDTVTARDALDRFAQRMIDGEGDATDAAGGLRQAAELVGVIIP